jgi:hypothetical protein
MVKILLSNVGDLHNVGVALMLKALTENFSADYFAHKLTVCKGYEQFGINYSWWPNGYDIALDMGGDTFTVYYGFLQFLRHTFHLFVLWVFRQPYALFAQTFCQYGPVTKKIAFFFMRHAVFITVRGYRSKKLLDLEGIPSILVADIAFLLGECNSTDYVGGSYHKLIRAMLARRKAFWDGSRQDNFKFDLFKQDVDLRQMKRRALKNFEVLQRFLSG